VFSSCDVKVHTFVQDLGCILPRLEHAFAAFVGYATASWHPGRRLGRTDKDVEVPSRLNEETICEHLSLNRPIPDFFFPRSLILLPPDIIFRGHDVSDRAKCERRASQGDQGGYGCVDRPLFSLYGCTISVSL
jgi:hypothetical protein